MLRSLSWLYSGVVNARNQLYEKGLLSVNQFNAPVVSVGNITAGGTGKTPMILGLLSWTNENNIKAGVVSRGYGGSYSGVQEVLLETEDPAKIYGDEPVLIKNRFSHIPFYVCRKRSQAVEQLINKHDVDIVFADDAYQHRALGRDLDIVMLDALQPEEHYKLLPLGRLREPLQQLSRADFIVVTRWNLATEAQCEFVLELIKTFASEKLRAVIQCGYKIARVGGVRPSDEVILFSGIGNPESFEKLMSERAQVVSHKVFEDHHAYSKEEIEDLLSRNKKLVTTEKDAVKLRNLNIDLSNIAVAELGLEFDSNVEKLFGVIRQLTH